MFKFSELLGNPKATETTKKLEMVVLNVKNSVDNNGQSAAKTLSLKDMGKVQRLEGSLVESSDSKQKTSHVDEDIV